MHVTHKRVYYQDTDAGGVVYHTRYAEFLEVARTEMFRDIGISAKKMSDQYGLIFPVIDLHLCYRKPAVYDDLLLIKTKIIKTSPIRIFFEYNIVDEKGFLYCDATSINCGMNKNNLKPMKFPKEFLAVLENKIQTLG